MRKETALDILFEEIKEKKVIIPDALFKYFHMIYDKAKQIEKQQIKDAYSQGLFGEEENPSISAYAEQYYNETYGK